MVQQRPARPAEQRILDSEPERDLSMTICIDAWRRLDSSRPLGMRPMPVKNAPPVLVPFAGAIPLAAVKAYGELVGLTSESILLLADVIERLDAARSKREAEEMRRPR